MTPVEFIPLAENEGMIAQVTDYVVDELFSELGEFWPGIRICILRLTCRPPISTLRGSLPKSVKRRGAMPVNIDQIKIGSPSADLLTCRKRCRSSGHSAKPGMKLPLMTSAPAIPICIISTRLTWIS